MTFVQIIEYHTTKFDQVTEVTDRWRAETEGKRTAVRVVVTADRDNPDTYLSLVEFPSYDDAMRNSALPETGKYAEEISSLCDRPPVFRNLDVVREENV